MRFEDLSLIPALLKAVHDEGYVTPTPIQQQSIPHVLAGKDLLGCAQTGTGKTAAFALPILQYLHGRPLPSFRYVRVLVLAPTRELATQIGDSFRVYGRHLGFRNVVIYGGVGQNPQVQALRKGVDIVVATPGRLLDLMEQGHAKLNHVEVLVLDEADRMLDMGFIHDVRRIVSTVPKKRQTLFFSATMPGDIQALAHDILSHPVRVEVTPTASTVDKVVQLVCHVGKGDKFTVLQKLMRDPAIARALVFTRTKHGANKLALALDRVDVRADAIHGNKAQSARERALKDFSRGKIRVLVATDIAARGIDVDGITHVFNYDLPNIPDSYVHRIGRTARAGAGGAAISFCGPEERTELGDIEKLIRMKIPVMAGYEASSRHVHTHPGRAGQGQGQGRGHGQGHGRGHAGTGSRGHAGHAGTGSRGHAGHAGHAATGSRGHAAHAGPEGHAGHEGHGHDTHPAHGGHHHGGAEPREHAGHADTGSRSHAGHGHATHSSHAGHSGHGNAPGKLRGRHPRRRR